MKICIDVDGVLADFNHGLNILLNKINPKLNISHNWEPDCRDGWSFLGVTDEQLKHAWDYIGHSNFWLNLRPDRTMKPLDWMRLRDLCHAHDVYFVTIRHTRWAKNHTETWLMQQGIPNPTVIITQDKGAIVKGIKADLFIDDDFDNVFDVQFASPMTKCYLKVAKWNMADQDKAKHKCTSLRDMLQKEETWEQEEINAGIPNENGSSESAIQC